MAEPGWIRVQRKTFTRWCNSHLAQVDVVITDLAADFQSGYAVHQLVSVLSKRTLPKAEPNPKLTLQKVQNVQTALDFLRKQENVKLVAISAEDIVNGNLKLILGLVWTLILKYQVCKPGEQNSSAKHDLLEWVNIVLNPQGCKILDFTRSWQDGSGFCGLLNAIAKSTEIDLSQLKRGDKYNELQYFNKAFEMSESKFKIPRLLDAEDVHENPDELSIMTYVSLFRTYLDQAPSTTSKVETAASSQEQALAPPVQTQSSSEQHVGAMDSNVSFSPAKQMEFIGGSLDKMLQDSKVTLTWPQVRNMALSIATGMAVLHHHQPPIIHRDLKSLNILVDDSGNVKVSDFGLGRTLGGNSTLSAAVGTFLWMAPEVMNEEADYGLPADVYSFGIIMWEFACRQFPYEGLDQPKVIAGVVSGNLRPSIPVTVPDAWTSLMQRCWSGDPSQRPTFDVILKELKSMQLPESVIPVLSSS